MKRAFTLLVVLGLIGFLPISCCLFTSCSCGESDLSDFRITGMSFSTINSTNIEIDTAVYHDVDSIYKQLTFSKEYLSSTINPKGHFLITSSYACSPAPGKSIQMFNKIQITALNSFTLLNNNDSVRAGEDITSRFEIAEMYSNDFHNCDRWQQNDRSIWEPGMFRIRLVDTVYQQTNMRLNFNVSLSDGSTFEAKNEIFNVE